MAQISKVIFGALALSLTCGAVQFASGHDLYRGQNTSAVAPETGVNRSAKADRAGTIPASGPTRTIALRFDSLADTSVLLRMPIAKEASSRPSVSSLNSSGNVTRTVACEPVVSVLTEIAKQLQPGRCVT